MYIRTIGVLLLVVSGLVAGLPAQSKTFPVSELKPGMVATGRTVFRGRPARGVQGPHPRRPAQRHRPAPRSDPRAARRRTARQHRRHRRHERQPGLYRRPPRRRGVVLARPVLKGTDRRHHADRRDDRGRDAAAVRARAGRPRRAARAAHAGGACATRCVRHSRGPVRSPTVPPTCSVIGDQHCQRRHRHAAASDRDAAHASAASTRASIDPLVSAFRDQGFVPVHGGRRTAGLAVVNGIGAVGLVLGAAAAGRSDRRRADERRPRARRHRHRHRGRRQPRLRVRPSVLRPRPDAVPDDARPRASPCCRASPAR